jgi:hypothetical protein
MGAPGADRAQMAALLLVGFARVAAQDLRLPIGALRRPSAGQVHHA